MIRSSTLAAAAIATLIAAGCDSAADERDRARAVADFEINQGKDEAEATMKAARADSDRKMVQAQAGFWRLREDYRRTMTVNLAGLDRKVVELDAREKTATGKAKADLEASLRTIHARRGRLEARFLGLEQATATTWDAASANLERQWTELNAFVDRT
jgi:predicted outer membrane protein